MQPRPVANWFHATSVAMEQWTAQHRAFVVEAYFKNGDENFANTLTFLVMAVLPVVTP